MCIVIIILFFFKDNLTLQEIIFINKSQVLDNLKQNSLYPSPLDIYTVDLILNSTPNFNYLYSNFSKNHKDAIYSLTSGKLDQNLLNFFYGSSLEVIFL